MQKSPQINFYRQTVNIGKQISLILLYKKTGYQIHKFDSIKPTVTFIWRRTAGQKILKSPGQKKKLVKSNKSSSRNFFWTKFHFFAISKMAKNQFLYWEKFKTAKNAISRIFLLNFHGKY